MHSSNCINQTFSTKSEFIEHMVQQYIMDCYRYRDWMLRAGYHVDEAEATLMKDLTWADTYRTFLWITWS